MAKKFDVPAFSPAEILLPKGCDLTRWAVVACDQYTSQPEYWQRVDEFVGKEPSSLRLILPESRLNSPSTEKDIAAVNSAMADYLDRGLFETCSDSLVLVERTLSDGSIRRGLVGKVDLEQYDYTPGSDAPIRATEGTVAERIPPRVAVRQNAPLELPHVMILCDDPAAAVIEPLFAETAQMRLLYDFDLMEQSGHLRGWLLTEEQNARVQKGLERLEQSSDMLFAVGDGNHSLATAKACYEQQKAQTDPSRWAELPSRWALAELVNIHDSGLVFEPIHRVAFEVDPEALVQAMLDFYPGAQKGAGAGHVIRCVYAGGSCEVTLPESAAKLPVGALQNFLDAYIPKCGGRIDYIHGDDVTCTLAEGAADRIGFLLPPLDKSTLFPAVVQDGVLPRKTFSMGEAADKRFYMEARRIR